MQRYVTERAREKYRGNPISARTIKKEVATLRAVWNRMAGLGYIAGPAPTRGLQYPKEEAKPPFRTREEIEAAIARGGLTEEEVGDLWDSLFLTVAEVQEVLALVRERAMFPFIYPMFCFVANTGARRSEMRRSLVEDVRFGLDKVQIREKKKDRNVKFTFRHVDMAPGLAAALREWFDTAHPGGIYTVCQPLRTGHVALAAKADKAGNHHPPEAEQPGHPERASISLAPPPIAAEVPSDRMTSEYVPDEATLDYRHEVPGPTAAGHDQPSPDEDEVDEAALGRLTELFRQASHATRLAFLGQPAVQAAIRRRNATMAVPA